MILLDIKRANVRKYIDCVSLNKNGIYPLLENWETNYNYDNLRDSIVNWKLYSNYSKDNINQLLEVVNKIHSLDQINKVSNIVTETIIPYLSFDDLEYMESKLNIINNENLQKELFNAINEQFAYDRVLSNTDLLDEVMDTDSIFSELYDTENLYFAVYKFTETVDNLDVTNDFSYGTKYWIALESALFYTSEYTQEFTDKEIKTITESVIDYYLINYGQDNINEFVSNIKHESDVTHGFIESNIITNYLNLIESVNNNIKLDNTIKLANKYFDQDKFDFIISEDIYGATNNAYVDYLNELSFVNNVKAKITALITKIKSSSKPKIEDMKAAIIQTAEEFPSDKTKEVVKAILKLTFLIIVIIGAFSIVAIATIFGFICHFIYSRYFSDKAKMEDALNEMKEHRAKIRAQINTEPVTNRRDRLIEYHRILNKNIEELEIKVERAHHGLEEKDPHQPRVPTAAEEVSSAAKTIGIGAAQTAIGYLALDNLINKESKLKLPNILNKDSDKNNNQSNTSNKSKGKGGNK